MSKLPPLEKKLTNSRVAIHVPATEKDEEESFQEALGRSKPVVKASDGRTSVMEESEGSLDVFAGFRP